MVRKNPSDRSAERVDLELLRTRFPVEKYTPDRIAEFLLNNAVSAEDYATALEEVRKLGIDPVTVPHVRPPGV